MIWQEKRPLRGKIRRGMRDIINSSPADIVSALSVVCLLGTIIISTMFIMGARPSSPAAVLSFLHRDFLTSPSSRTGRDPYPVSRADHGRVVAGGSEK